MTPKAQTTKEKKNHWISSELKSLDFLSGPVVKKSACQCKGYGFNPWYWRILYVTGQLSLCTATAEPASGVSVPQQENSQ